ncbi:MAG: GNAT family N-acetyltransferase [Candidatus Nanopelagicales bacterium]
MHVRVASAEEVLLLQEWALREEWGAGVGDIEAFHRVDPEGFLLAWDGDAAVGSISAVRYSPDYSFVGYYIVDPALRGRGIGHRLFDAALARIGPASSGLDGVPEQIDTYASLGYELAHMTPRYKGDTAVIAASLAGESLDVREVTAADLPAVLAYDAQHCPAPREAFAREWFAPGGRRRSLLATRGGAVCGLAAVRPLMGGGARIGPLFADDLAVARALLGACATTAVMWGDRISLDVPDVNAAAIDLVTSLGMTTDFACGRMYRGPVRALPLDRIWASTSYELG